MKHHLMIGAAALLTLCGASFAEAAALSPVAAVADPSRPEKDRALDPTRKPADMIVFAKIKPGDKVTDVWPGGGYWSRLFSDVVGPEGKVYAYVPAEIAGAKSDPIGLAKAIGAEPGHANVMEVSDPLSAPPPSAHENALDVVWTFENYHDFHDSFMKGASVPDYNVSVFKALKPGGYYVIVDHAAPAGSELTDTETLHRIDPATVRAEVEKAGFVFDGESKVLANPDDPKTAKVFDPFIKGKTDRFAYRFRKPKS